MLKALVEFTDTWRSQIPWFPAGAELKTERYYLYPWSSYYHGERATAAELIFVRPEDGTVFFFGGKT